MKMFISDIQRIVLCETKAVSIIHWDEKLEVV